MDVFLNNFVYTFLLLLQRSEEERKKSFNILFPEPIAKRGSRRRLSEMSKSICSLNRADTGQTIFRRYVHFCGIQRVTFPFQH